MSRRTEVPAPSGLNRLRTTRTAVVALLLVVIVLPGLTGGVAFWRARSVIIEQVEDGQKAAVAALVEGLSWGLEIANTAAANGAADESLQAAVRRGDRVAVEAHLRDLHSVLPLYRTLAVVDADGDVVANWPLPLTDSDARNAGTSRRVFPSRTSGPDAVVAVRHPSSAEAALVAEISLLAVAPQLQTFRFGDTGTATLVASDGQVLIAGASERRNQRLRAPEVLAAVTAMQPDQMRYYGPLLQRRNISTYEPVPTWQFGVLVDMAEREAFAHLTGLAALIVAVVLGLVVIGLIGILVIARRLASSERGLQQAHEDAERQALTDPLTGLANRRAFDERLKRAAEYARSTGGSLSVTMLDLNRFKRLNDSRGHAAGDAALRAVANEIKGAVRVDDVAARLGGDEFALLQLDCTEEAAARVAARICDAVARLGVLCDSEAGAVLTVSAGTAQYENGMTAEELVATADVSLYRAKEQTRLVSGESAAGRRERSH